MYEQPSAEHAWLHQMIGQWNCETFCSMGPDKPPMRHTGTMTVRSLGGLWTIGEGTMDTGEGNAEGGKTVLTLGYDPRARRFVGTFIASMMTHLWPYDGVLDEATGVLTLDSAGPSFFDDGAMAKYQDMFAMIDANYFTLSSRVQSPDGVWHDFMTAHYRRA